MSVPKGGPRTLLQDMEILVHRNLRETMKRKKVVAEDGTVTWISAPAIDRARAMQVAMKFLEAKAKLDADAPRETEFGNAQRDILNGAGTGGRDDPEDTEAAGTRNGTPIHPVFGTISH